LPSYRQPSAKDSLEKAERWKGESKHLLFDINYSSISKVLKRYEDKDENIRPHMVRSDLIIRNVRRNDSGVYICVADNDHDTASAATYIRVECKHDFEIVELELQLMF
jgi:hypothetical protein